MPSNLAPFCLECCLTVEFECQLLEALASAALGAVLGDRDLPPGELRTEPLGKDCTVRSNLRSLNPPIFASRPLSKHRVPLSPTEQVL
jgi:hypothetical protein